VILFLEFPDGGNYNYTVETFKPLNYGIDALEAKNLALMLPFYVLKLRKRVASARSSEVRTALSAEMRALLGDIVVASERAVKAGVLNEADGRAVIEYTDRLYMELYQGYKEFKEADAMLKDTILTYSEEAELRGIEEGMKKGIEEGREKGIEEGMEKGIEKGIEKMAEALLAMGISPDAIKQAREILS